MLHRSQFGDTGFRPYGTKMIGAHNNGTLNKAAAMSVVAPPRQLMASQTQIYFGRFRMRGSARWARRNGMMGSSKVRNQTYRLFIRQFADQVPLRF